jgi:hypothetical protein
MKIISLKEAKEKGLHKYFIGTPCKYGHVSERFTKSSCCCSCSVENSWSRFKDDPTFRQARRRAFKKHYKKNRTHILKKAAEWEKANPERKMLASAKARAKKKGLLFNLELLDIYIPSICPVLGIELKSNGKRTDNSPTLDRRDCSLGYTKGNILVISWKANRIKNNATFEELQRIAKFFTS